MEDTPPKKVRGRPFLKGHPGGPGHPKGVPNFKVRIDHLIEKYLQKNVTSIFREEGAMQAAMEIVGEENCAFDEALTALLLIFMMQGEEWAWNRALGKPKERIELAIDFSAKSDDELDTLIAEKLDKALWGAGESA